MLGTKRILNQITRMRLYLRPQRLAYPDCRVLSVGSLAGTDCLNIIPFGSHQFPASEPPGNFFLESHLRHKI